MKYITTIGLEVHAELKTRTKMFCDSLNDPDEVNPNVNVCPVCMAHPGSLPVMNKEAIKKVLMTGMALDGELAEYSQFDRKNYFYPDLPKGYQISQYKFPLVNGGELNGVKITRIHLEEDTGRLAHVEDGSLVDFNRAGVPLMELVTEPDIKSGDEAKKFAEELQLILRYLGVSEANMEKGQMRVEANISIRLEDVEIEDGSGNSAPVLGTKVEVKNLNSFRAVERAINYEAKRQAKVLDGGGKITQETRGWDENKQQTFSQREKEESHDYRYFPEPDLPPLDVPNLGLGEIIIPELPRQKRERFKDEYKLKEDQIEILVRDKSAADFFEAVVSELKTADAKLSSEQIVPLAANYLISDLQSLMKEKGLAFNELPVTPENFAELIGMISGSEITSRVGKDVLKIMTEKGGDPSIIVQESGLKQTNDESAIRELVDKIIAENPDVAEGYRNGKEASLQFLIGQGMKETKGSVNPAILKEILITRIKAV